MVNKREHS